MEMQRGGSGLSRVLSDAVTALETRRCCASPSFHLLRQGSLRLSPPLARISPTRLTYTRPRMNAPRRPTGFHRAPNKHASTTATTTTTTVHGSSFREPPRSCFFFLFFLRRLPLGSASASRFFEASIEPTPLPTRNLRGGPRRVFKLFASPGEIRRGKPSVCSANPGRTVLYYPAPGAPERSTVCNRGRIEEERFFSGKINANFDSRKNFFSKDVRGNAVALDLCVERGLVNREGCSATFLRVFANGLSITVN